MSTQSLRKDHKLIEKVLHALDATLKLLKDGKQIPEQILLPTLDFTQNFTDVCHHGKEEEALFPALEKAAICFVGRLRCKCKRGAKNIPPPIPTKPAKPPNKKPIIKLTMMPFFVLSHAEGSCTSFSLIIINRPDNNKLNPRTKTN